MDKVVSYCVEYAKTDKSNCAECKNPVPVGQARIGRLTRKDKKQKKMFASVDWMHLGCFTIPDILTRLPTSMIRGFPELRVKDQAVFLKLLAIGAGKKWSDLYPDDPIYTVPVASAKKMLEKRTRTSDSSAKTNDPRAETRMKASVERKMMPKGTFKPRKGDSTVVVHEGFKKPTLTKSSDSKKAIKTKHVIIEKSKFTKSTDNVSGNIHKVRKGGVAKNKVLAEVRKSRDQSKNVLAKLATKKTSTSKQD